MIAKHEFAGKVRLIIINTQKEIYLSSNHHPSFLTQPTHQQRETLIAVAPSCPTLKSIVEKAKTDGNITIKNSPGRNLHRLINSIAFITEIFKGLLINKNLKDAVSIAYDNTLSQLHNWVVRTGIKAGMIGLPSREHFLESIGETEESAREHGQAFVVAAEKLLGHINSLYDGVTMPRSDFTMNSLWGGK